jgi:hypothetical protein
MKTLIVFGLVVLAILIYPQQRDQDVTLELSAGDMIRHTDDFDVRFTQQETLADAFMIFGGHVDRKLSNSFSDYSLGALQIGDAAQIRQKYPDFHLCKSPGAKLAQNKIRTLALIMENPQVAEVVETSIELHSERVRQGRERTCLALRGRALQPAAVTLRENDRDISSDILPKLGRLQYYLIDGAELRDCLSLL